MKKLILFATLTLLPLPAMANVSVTAAMQKCTSNSECTLVSNNCAKACATVPVNQAYVSTVKSQLTSLCPAPLSALPACTIHPPLQAACINQRCTLGSAYQSNGDARDYQGHASAK